jgi:hypothetical protein
MRHFGRNRLNGYRHDERPFYGLNSYDEGRITTTPNFDPGLKEKGDVNSRSEKRIAEALADDVFGVRDIENQLKIRSPE